MFYSYSQLQVKALKSIFSLYSQLQIKTLILEFHEANVEYQPILTGKCQKGRKNGLIFE